MKIRPPVVFAVLVTLAGAYLGAALGSRIGLNYTTHLPSHAAAARLSQTVFPGIKVWGGRPAAPVERQPDGGGVEYGWSQYWVRHTAATRDVAAYSAGARDRLAATGWKVHDYKVCAGRNRSASFWASRPGLVLRYDDELWTGYAYYASDGAAQYGIRRDDPPTHYFGWAGAALGAIVAYLLFGFVRRRTDFPDGGNVIVGITTGAMLFLLLPSTLFSQPPDVPGREPWWSGFLTDPGRGSAIVSGFVAGILLLLAVFHREGRARALLARHWRPVMAAVLVVAAGFSAYGLIGDNKAGAHPPCHPTAGVPVAPRAGGGSDRVHVYIDPAATPDQRNLIVAAMRRSWALAEEPTLIWQPDSREFRDQYCNGGPIPAAAVAGLPYFFAVKLDYGPDYPALVSELEDQAGVLSIQRVPA